MPVGGSFLFLPPSVPDQLDRSQKAEINAHIARHAHYLRRTKEITTSNRNKSGSALTVLKSDQSEPSPGNGQLVRKGFHGVCSSTSCYPNKSSPPIVPWHGNSDPFNVQCVPLDSHANLYLTFGVQMLENTILETGYRGWCMPRGWAPLKRASALCSASLNLDGQRESKRVAPAYLTAEWSTTHSYSILAYYATTLANVTGVQRYTHDALEYTTKCIASLRRLINGVQHGANVDVEILIYRLLRAEIVSRDYLSASTHTNLLGRLFRACEKEKRLDLGVLALALYQDNTLSLTLWRKPTYDSTWLYKVYKDNWSRAGLYLQEDRLFTAELRSICSDNESLNKLFHATSLLFTQGSCMQNTGQMVSMDDWYWFLSYGEYLQTCLINFYINQNLTTATGLTSSTSEMHKCLALGALLALRYRKNELKVNSIALFSASTNILARLTACTNQLESHITYEEAFQYADALLWVSFVAALVEHTLSNPKPVQERKSTWFRRLIQSIISRNFTSFQELQDVLFQFPYTHDELPLPVTGWLDSVFRLSMEDDAPSFPSGQANIAKSDIGEIGDFPTS